MSSEGVEIIFHYFPDLSAEQKKQYTQLLSVYQEWNTKINVISRNDIQYLYERHVLHSLGIARVINFKKNTTVLDVGTGGGFPGIPLAILFPEVNFTLVDSIGKKIKVVTAVSEALGLKNVRAINSRVEPINDKFDFVVSRAVTDFETFYNWVKDKISNRSFNTMTNGILYLKGGDLREELAPFKSKVKLYSLHDHFKTDFYQEKYVVYLGK